MNRESSLTVNDLLTFVNKGAIQLSDSFIRELKGYPSDSVVIPVETVDGKRLIVLDKDKAHEIMRAFKDRI